MLTAKNSRFGSLTGAKSDLRSEGTVRWIGGRLQKVGDLPRPQGRLGLNTFNASQAGTSAETLQEGGFAFEPLASNAFYRTSGKRMFDVLALLVLTPFVLVVVLCITLVMLVNGEGARVFFGHRRVGRDGRAFKCWKIRTMVVNADERLREHLKDNPEAAEEWARDHKLDDDPRITKIGGFLRKTSLDELPQLVNVAKGEMSFVGPRPIVRTELHKYGAYRKLYQSVTPGVTGLWQVSGRNDVSYDERVELDVKYVQSISMRNDLQVMVQTVSALATRTGK